MNWRNAFFAGLIRLRSFAGRGFFHRSPRISGGGSDTAPITRQTQTPSYPPQLALETVIHKRAQRTCNRDRDLVARYVRTQTILSKGR